VYDITGVMLDKPMDKSVISDVISSMSDKFGKEDAIQRLKRLQDLGFQHSTQSGLSLCYDDMKFDFGVDFDKIDHDLSKMSKQERLEYADKVINDCVDKWFREVDRNNPLFIMSASGARVTPVQVRQMIVAKGLLSSMTGEIAEYPIMESLSSGMGTFNYFRTCGPARRGLADNFFVVPAGGYFSRQLVTTSRDLVVSELDCGATKGIPMRSEFTRGRIKAGTNILIDTNKDQLPGEIKYIRSPTVCESKSGVCARCCGFDPATKQYWRIGLGLGTVSAQHISEPVQQKSMQGKHQSGGTTLKTNTNKITNVLGDVMRFFEGKGTTFINSSESTVETITSIFEKYTNYEEFCFESLNYIMNILENAKINIAPIHLEMIIRGCTDIVMMADGNLGLRSSGDEGTIIINGVINTGKNYPSWLKRMGFGYINETINKAIFNHEETKGVLTEQIMIGKLT
jgi:DNA-directed RNA polymerase subunit beta'